MGLFVGSKTHLPYSDHYAIIYLMEFDHSRREYLVRTVGSTAKFRGSARWRNSWRNIGIAALGVSALIISTGCSLVGNTEAKQPSVDAPPTKPVAAFDTPTPFPTYPPFPTSTPRIETPVPKGIPQQPNFVQEDAFLQCTNINYLPESNLLIDPLTMPNGPKNPQIQHAIDTLYRNSIYDLINIDLLPQATKLKFISSMQYTFCLPDELSGKSRFFIQTSEGSGLNLPYGNVENRLAEFILPEGLNPIVLIRMGQRYPGSNKEKQEWLFFNLQKNQEIGFRNANGSSYNIGKGPLAFQTAGSMRYVEFIKPDKGFADDKPIPKNKR